MREYIVFDLEWNQGSRGKEEVADQLPFEIFEIGAVKLNDKFEMTDQFCRLIRPQVYTKMHWMIQEVTHVEMEELQENGMDFVDASREFFDWCGPDAVFCTWGSMDLTELQRNLDFYRMENPFPKPLLFFDVQKLYGLAVGDGKRISLDTAVEEAKDAKKRPVHRAKDDARDTGQGIENTRLGEMECILFGGLSPASRRSERRDPHDVSGIFQVRLPRIFLKGRCDERQDGDGDELLRLWACTAQEDSLVYSKPEDIFCACDLPGTRISERKDPHEESGQEIRRGAGLCDQDVKVDG